MLGEILRVRFAETRLLLCTHSVYVPGTVRKLVRNKSLVFPFFIMSLVFFLS